MQERPLVTITNPADRGRPADVLDADDPAPGNPQRLVVAAGVVLALLAGVSGVDGLRERRAADAEERRLQTILQVELTDRFGSFQTTDFDGGTQEAVLSRALGLRNTGPRPVVVESVAVDGLRLVGGEVEVAPGQEERLLVQHRLPCSPAPAATSASLSVLLGVRTGAGTREQALLLDPEMTAYGEDARRACGIVPPGEAVQLFSEPGGRAVDGVLDVSLRIASFGARTTRLLDLQAGNGRTAELLDDTGRGVALPLEIEPRLPDGGVVEQPFRLRLRVVDCAVVDASDSQPYESGSAFTLSYVVADDSEPEGAGATTTVLYDANPVRDLVADACP